MKNFKLSFVDSTTFTGKDAEGFYSAALLSGTSTNNFKLIPDVKSKIKLAKLDMGELLQDADCSFSGAGEGTLSQKSFEVEPLKINLSYCARTFESNYLSEMMRAGSNSDQVMPDSVEEYLLSQSAKQASNDLEKVTWEGNTASATYPLMRADGIIKKLGATGSGVIGVTGATTLSTANIVSKIAAVYDAIPDTIINKEDTVIFIGTAAFKYYRQAIANASAETYVLQNYAELSYLGLPIVEAPGMGANTIVAGQKSNFLFLTDLVSDFEDVLVLPQKTVTGEPVVRMVAEFKFGVDFLYGSEIVLYRA